MSALIAPTIVTLTMLIVLLFFVLLWLGKARAAQLLGRALGIAYLIATCFVFYKMWAEALGSMS